MNKFSNEKIFLLIFLIISLVSLSFFLAIKVSSQENVDVNAIVGGCTLQVTVYPEKRIPVTGNWGTNLDVELYLASNNQYQGTLTGLSNNSGIAVFDVCDEISPVATDYKIYIRGKSHLRRNYGIHTLFNTPSSSLDLSSDGKLIAGETSIVYDNFINVLDISTQISKLETNDDKNDLNQDGEVNVLDIATSINNYLTEGDCSPKESEDGICT